jgi:hypothetical protein
MRNELVGLCVAKNEADIIEAMVRHNLCFLDRLRVVNNDSADSTVSILRKLQDEYGDRLEIKSDMRSGHPQTKIINEALLDPTFTDQVGQVVLLDADEFIKADRDVFRTTLTEARFPIRLPWVTYIPTSDDDKTEINPIARIIHRRVKEKPQFFKVSVPRELFGQSWVRPGSHSIRSKISGHEPREVAGLSIAHFPIRSREQAISKLLIGSWNMRLRSRNSKGEALQWRSTADRILSGWLPTETDVQELALNYASTKPSTTLREALFSPTSVELKYTASEYDDLLRKLIAFTEVAMRMIEGSNQAEGETLTGQEDL